MELIQAIDRRRKSAPRVENSADLTGEPRHRPALLAEAVDAVVGDPNGLYLDATLGLGGHANGLLSRLGPGGRLLGLDLDPQSLEIASKRLEPWGARFHPVRANFRSLGPVLEAEKFYPLAGALFDLGVSSLHFDSPERGFSFSQEGPLDMRLSPDSPLTADAIVNRWPVEQLAMLIKEYGEDPDAQRIARAIVSRRETRPIRTTTELAAVIASVSPRTGSRHPATRTFMALRIAVNAELENLTRGLEAVLPYMAPGGRIVVISFHSLEDRMVKNVFSSFVAQGWCRWIGSGSRGSAVTPTEAEIRSNPRARSAKMRAVEHRGGERPE
jgi:16S rRNA (cytosine1402-N4)-methyltransferase